MVTSSSIIHTSNKAKMAVVSANQIAPLGMERVWHGRMKGTRYTNQRSRPDICDTLCRQTIFKGKKGGPQVEVWWLACQASSRSDRCALEVRQQPLAFSILISSTRQIQPSSETFKFRFNRCCITVTDAWVSIAPVSDVTAFSSSYSPTPPVRQLPSPTPPPPPHTFFFQLLGGFKRENTNLLK